MTHFDFIPDGTKKENRFFGCSYRIHFYLFWWGGGEGAHHLTEHKPMQLYNEQKNWKIHRISSTFGGRRCGQR